ncbi:mycofactocin-coupled SDR family oxidoreductase [Geodermatophilus aquaeductus]
MPGRMAGKVVFVTGAGRGMGRSHAVRLAREGADVIGMDVCGPIPSATGPVTTPEDLAETVRDVEALDRRMVTFQADVRDEDALTAGLADGVAQLGRLDCAIANAGIGVPPHEVADTPAQEWRDMLEVNLTGVFLTAKAAVPHIRAHGDGGSVLLVSSALGLRGMANVASYVAAKHGVVGLMRSLALELAAERIRVNSIHPTNVDTPLIQNENVYRLFRPDLEHPTRQDVSGVFQDLNLLPTPWVQPEDVSEAVLYLAADDSGRWITGTTHRVDAGWLTK